MSRLLERCLQFFNTENLYEVLGVTKDASIKDLKKGYHKKSLVHHPDRAAPGDETRATQQFQVLAQVHCLLSDDGRRAEYDETGVVDDEVAVDEEKDWQQYWRLLFPKITTKDIQEFADKYKGSEEELSDLKCVYLDAEGDLTAIMNRMMCSEQQDESRFRDILSDLIKTGELPSFSAFTKETEKKKKSRAAKARKEAAEAQEAAKRLRLDDDTASLTALIAQRQASRARQADDFFSHLEAKYGDSQAQKKGRKKKKAV